MPEYLHSKLIRISNAKTNGYLVVIVMAFIPGYDDADDSQSACYSLTQSTYRQTGGRWLPVRGMQEKRAYAASSYWPGHGLLVTGGRNGYVTLSSTEYLSTFYGERTPGPVLPEEIAGHCQVTVGPDVIITGNINHKYQYVYRANMIIVREISCASWVCFCRSYQCLQAIHYWQ